MTATPPVALVTGASSGIGKAATLALSDAGFRVIGTSRDTSQGTPGNDVTFLDLDVTSDESVTNVVGQVIARFGRLDVLANNAGVGTNGAAEEISVAQAQTVFDVNVFGLMRMTKAVLPHMRAQGSGRIINVSSVAGFRPQPVHVRVRLDQARSRGLLRVPGPRSPRTRRAGPVRPARSDQHPVRRQHGAGRHPATDLRAPTACLRGRHDGDDARRRRSRRRRRGDRRGATDPKPKLRYLAGSTAGRVAALRHIVPARTFDKRIRKLNRTTG